MSRRPPPDKPRPRAGAGHGRRADQVHVEDGRAGIVRRQKTATQTVDRLTQSEHHRVGLVGRIGHDHALAAAERQPGHGSLARHRLRQAQRIAQGRVFRRIGAHPASAEGGPARRAVDCDDGVKPGRGIRYLDNPFVAGSHRGAKLGHGDHGETSCTFARIGSGLVRLGRGAGGRCSTGNRGMRGFGRWATDGMCRAVSAGTAREAENPEAAVRRPRCPANPG